MIWGIFTFACYPAFKAKSGGWLAWRFIFVLRGMTLSLCKSLVRSDPSFILHILYFQRSTAFHNSLTNAIANSLNSLYLMNWLLFSIAALLNICIINFILEREWWTWRTIATGVKRWQRRRNTRKDDETWYFLEGSASHPSRLVLRALLLLETYNARCSFDPPIMILLDFVLPYCECVRSQSEQTIQ
jgi:hypothetical protein